MKVYSAAEYPQLSEAWFKLRAGVPTASQFGRIVTPKTGKLSASADDYICSLIAELHHPGPYADIQVPCSKAMLHGTECEPEARAWYAMERGLAVEEVGFVTTDDGRFGCSPDGLLTCTVCGNDWALVENGEIRPLGCADCKGAGFKGGLELKCPQRKTQVAYLLDGTLPSEYRAQVHGSLIVSGLPYWDFLSYCPGFDPLLLRVTPDAFTDYLRDALEKFWVRYQELKAKIGGAK